jgi:hypothetical protein
MPDWKKYAFEVNNKKRNLKTSNRNKCGGQTVAESGYYFV